MTTPHIHIYSIGVAARLHWHVLHDLTNVVFEAGMIGARGGYSFLHGVEEQGEHGGMRIVEWAFQEGSEGFECLFNTEVGVVSDVGGL